LSDKIGQTLTLHCYGTNKQMWLTTAIWRSHWRRRRYIEDSRCRSRDDI